MGTVEPVIDLGFAPSHDEVAFDHLRRPTWRWSRLPRWQRHLAALVVLLVAVALLPAGSYPPSPPRFGPPLVIGSAFDKRVVLVDGGVLTSTGGGNQVRGYGFDGRMRWQIGLDFGGSGALLFGGSPVAMLGNGVRVVGLSTATGSIRWQGNGQVLGLSGGTVTLGNGAFFGTGTGPSMLAGVAAADGRETWRLELTESQDLVRVVAADRPSTESVTGFARVDTDGVAEYVTAATGAHRTLAEWPRQNGHTMALDLAGMLVVFSGRADGGAIHAYGPDAAHPRWTRSYAGVGVSACGGMLCLDDHGGVRVVDPRTGAERRWYPFPAVAGSWGDRLLAYRSAGDGDGHLVTADAASGQVIRALRQLDPIRWALATLRLSDGVAYPLGQLTAGGGQPPCEVDATHLACGTLTGGIQVWRYVPSGRRYP
jgi:hypothetical protein